METQYFRNYLYNFITSRAIIFKRDSNAWGSKMMVHFAAAIAENQKSWLQPQLRCQECYFIKKNEMKLKIYQSFPSLSGSSHVPHLLQFKIHTLGLDSNHALPLQKKKKKVIIFCFAQTWDPDKKEARKQTH